MNEKKENFWNVSQNLSNTVKIKISHQAKENKKLNDKNENENKLTITSLNMNNTQPISTQFIGNSFIQKNRKNRILNKDSIQCKGIDQQEYKDNIKNLYSLIENKNVNERKSSASLGIISLTNKVKFHEFFLNNNKKNKAKYNHSNNTISTTKYNILTFIPKSLLIQFARLPNVYFLATAIIQSIPLISPLSSVTAIFPLIFVLSISMIRDLIVDLSR